ncbi:glycosyl transferase family 4-domain-containing protein [Endogone sp. FLAS-F59071]|nr:glycosyl transferase family 4-domain-containing protein [Endogone sp. FLAS-F59071]|eukprot:RUS18090.1 glycosyl transferase family 4-domain-containing protein [Endogone sp. FLAS-F59071]
MNTSETKDPSPPFATTMSSTSAIALASTVIASLALIVNTAHDPLTVSLGFSVIAAIATFSIIPQLKETFITAKIVGTDVLKKDRPVIPETMGLVCGVVYLTSLFLFIPFPFMEWLNGHGTVRHFDTPAIPTFPYHKLGEILSAMLALQSMILLGFADDVFDIRWRHKVYLPAIASIPLLIVYYTNFGITDVVVPIQLRPWLGRNVDLGLLYYVYMTLVAIFCTHSINILAGINGVEAGQSLVIAISVAINDMLFISGTDPLSVEAHLLSLYFILPFIGVTTGLLWHNWFPARVFVGDTYCYFAGMTFAVVGILGHFSKTLLLFFLPQIFNFLYSAPQIFNIIGLPRHRMPSLNVKTGRLEYSRVSLNKKPIGAPGRIILRVFEALRIAEIKRDDQGEIVETNNFTLINLLLVKLGPMSEGKVTVAVMVVQAVCSMIAFFVRYRLVKFVYDGDGLA